MKHKHIFSVLLFIMAHLALGQNSALLGQYFKVMPTFAPALTGANMLLDVKVGTRNQRVGVSHDGSFQTSFFSANGNLNISKKYAREYNSHPVRDMSTYDDRVVRIGLGGYVIDEELDLVTQTTGAITSAVHVPINQKANISMGVAIGFNNTRIDLDNLFVRDPNDQTYIRFISDGFQRTGLKMDYGLAAYSDRFYLSYSLIMTNLGQSESTIQVSPDRLIAQHIVGGYSFSVDSKFEIIPNFHARKVEQFDFLLDMGTRVRYRNNTYAGVSYRTNQTLIFMLGFITNDRIDIGYSFESSELNPTSPYRSSHEIVLGIRLFNHGKYVPLW